MLSFEKSAKITFFFLSRFPLQRVKNIFQNIDRKSTNQHHLILLSAFYAKPFTTCAKNLRVFNKKTWEHSLPSLDDVISKNEGQILNQDQKFLQKKPELRFLEKW